MQLEVEMKFRVDDPAATLARLTALGVELSAPLEQIDTYFQHPARDFTQTDEAFRLRQIGNGNYFTYKGPKLDAETKTRRELEVPLASGNVAADEYQELLFALGFPVGGVVHKQRSSGSCELAGKEVEIAWDEVSELGQFLELEMVVDDTERAAATAALKALAQELRLERAERRSYLEMVLEKRR
jgi:adenylate cyclase class 2